MTAFTSAKPLPSPYPNITKMQLQFVGFAFTLFAKLNSLGKADQVQPGDPISRLQDRRKEERSSRMTDHGQRSFTA
jgi:hypothetical protein